jgi:hypothetical protein
MALPAPRVGDPNAQLNFEALAKVVFQGLGDPNGRVTAAGGALFFRRDAAGGAAVYVHTAAAPSSVWTALA